MRTIKVLRDASHWFPVFSQVRSLTEKEDAEVAAWNAPGVTSVTSNIEIEAPEYAFFED